MECSSESDYSEEEVEIQDSVLVRLGYPYCFAECFATVLSRCLLYPRSESGVAVKPISYFSRNKINSLMQEYDHKRYALHSKQYKFIYRLWIETEVKDYEYVTKCTLLVTPRTKTSDLGKVIFVPATECRYRRSTTPSCYSVEWSLKAPIGYYDPKNWTKPAGLLQAASAVTLLARRHLTVPANT